MKTKLINMLCLMLVILFTSCNSEKKKENLPSDDQTIESIADNSMNALDWSGTYEGELPCTDCDGIKTVVTIKNDNTYVIKEIYLGKDAKPLESNGSFKWDEQGQKIILSNKDRQAYFVGENTLTHLDEDGNKITGDMEGLYILNKVNDQLAGKKWHLASFKGAEIVYKEAMSEHAYVQFKDDQTIIGYTGCNNLQGAYDVEEAQKIKFSKLINTLKACPEMDTEGKFLQTLNSAEAYGFEDHNLIMYDQDHQKLATFKVAN